jgi:protein-disulfide isomerase
VGRAAYEKGGDKLFWEAHKALFESNPKLEDPDLEAICKKLGLSWDAVKNAITTGKYEAKITQSMDLASDLNARGTPHFFINGLRLSGAQPIEKFQEVIDKRLAEAKQLVASGTPKASVYDKIMETAKGPPPPETKNVPAPSRRRPVQGRSQRQGRHPALQRLPVPLLFARGADHEGDREGVRRQGEDRVAPHAAPHAPGRPARLRGRHRGLRAEGQRRVLEVPRRLFERQREPDALKRPGLEKLAQEQGLDMAKFKAALDSRQHKARVDADMKAGNDAGISGTPAIVINQYFVSGAQPFPSFKKLIELALKEAK